MLYTYATIIGLLLLLEVTAVGLVVYFQGYFAQQIHDGLDDAVQNYGSSSLGRISTDQLIDDIQSMFVAESTVMRNGKTQLTESTRVPAASTIKMDQNRRMSAVHHLKSHVTMFSEILCVL